MRKASRAMKRVKKARSRPIENFFLGALFSLVADEALIVSDAEVNKGKAGAAIVMGGGSTVRMAAVGVAVETTLLAKTGFGGRFNFWGVFSRADRVLS